MQVIIKKSNRVPQEEVFERVLEIKENYNSPYSVEITYKDDDDFIYTLDIRLDGYTELLVR